MFARIDLFADDVVGDLAERAADELRWGVDAGHIKLFLVRRDGEDEPTSEEEAAALNGPRLGATVSLERAGIMDGICLLAKVTAPASKLGKNQRAYDKAGYANPRLGASQSTSRAAFLQQLRAVAAAPSRCQGRSSCTSRMLTSSGTAP